MLVETVSLLVAFNFVCKDATLTEAVSWEVRMVSRWVFRVSRLEEVFWNWERRSRVVEEEEWEKRRAKVSFLLSTLDVIWERS